VSTEKAQADSLLLMRMAEYSYEERRLWKIWAAKTEPCEVCGAKPFEACQNMNEAKKGNTIPCRNPHEPRINWSRMKRGLMERLLGE
jgi:hypothetical protein